MAPTYGAAPLAKTFLLVRIFQMIAFVSIIGIFANFTAQIISTGLPVAKEISGTLSVTCLAAFYTLISLPLFWAEGSLTLLLLTALDSLLLVAFIVIAVVLGRPLSYVDCSIISSDINADAWAFVNSIRELGWSSEFVSLAAADKAVCYESKAVWGMSIALCILFAMSVLLLPVLFIKHKRSQSAAASSKGWGA